MAGSRRPTLRAPPIMPAGMLHPRHNIRCPEHKLIKTCSSHLNNIKQILGEGNNWINWEAHRITSLWEWDPRKIRVAITITSREVWDNLVKAPCIWMCLLSKQIIRMRLPSSLVLWTTCRRIWWTSSKSNGKCSSPLPMEIKSMKQITRPIVINNKQEPKE